MSSHEVPLFDESWERRHSLVSQEEVRALVQRVVVLGRGHAWMDKCLHSVDLKTCLGGARDLRSRVGKIVLQVCGNTTIVGGNRWGPPLVDEDWHVVCWVDYEGIAGDEWERSCYKYVEVHKAVNIRKAGYNHKAKFLWMFGDAKTNGEAYYDRSGERQNLNRTKVRQDSWEVYMQSPTAALEEALKSTEAGAERAVSSAAGGSET